MINGGSKQFHVLVVDDLPPFVQEIRQVLTSAGIRVTTCPSPLRALKLIRRTPFDLLITTLVMKEMGGFDLIRGVRSISDVPIMMITGYGSEQAAIEATRLGAADYMDKPVAPAELIARVYRIVDPSRSALSGRSADRSDELITSDPAMRSVLETVQVLAGTQSRVLITGETGTGKQLVARAIHNGSARRAEPFVDVNCAAIPETLLESELFGHERGAFTGATAQRVGRFEEAGRGTIFLDEIGEMNYAMQSKLLKVLQDARFSRVGGSRLLTCHARVIAATNRDLEHEVAQGRFRSDLYYRLQVMTVVLPPLRRRPGDIPQLAERFLARFTPPGQPPRAFAPETLQLMMRYHWPGNVRELENLVERIAVLYRGAVIQPDALPERILQNAMQSLPTTAAAPLDGTYPQAKTQFEIAYLKSVLIRARGNMAEGARLAGIDRSQFFRMVKRHGIDPRAGVS